MAGLGALLCLGIGFELVNPQVIRYFLDTAQSTAELRWLYLAAAVYITFAILNRVVDVVVTYLSETVSWSATNGLRDDLARHLLRLDLSFHKQHAPGELIERVDGDTLLLANFFAQFIVQTVANLLLIVGILVLLGHENPTVAISLAGYALAALGLLGSLHKPAAARWKADSEARAAAYGFIEERLGGVEDIRAVGAVEFTLARLACLLRNFMVTRRRAFVTSARVEGLTNILAGLGYALGLVLGIWMVVYRQASLGSAYLVTAYVGMLSTPLQNLRRQAQDFQGATASLQRISELLAYQSPIRDIPQGEWANLPAGALPVQLDQVTFRYEDDQQNVLSNITLAVQPGQVLGILGRTGSGKTTLTRLLTRQYDPDAGSLRLGEVELRALPISELRQRIGMVTQEVQLFAASLRDNLTLFNPDISDHQIWQGLRELGLESWAKGMPEGLDTHLQAGGAGLSAGEAQLLAFARVFLRNPGVIILDEASSRLDPATEQRLEQAIDRLLAGRSGIIVAHRLSTVQRADDILILEDGCVVEYGRRLDLIADSASRFSGLLKTGLEEMLA